MTPDDIHYVYEDGVRLTCRNQWCACRHKADDDTPVTTYHYPPRVAPQPVTLHGLDAVMPANASERTAPRRTVVVERALLVDLLDAWQAWSDAVDSDDETAGIVEFAALEETVREVGEAIA